jgi:hypothetical protein
VNGGRAGSVEPFRGNPEDMRSRRRGNGRLVWPAAALPGLLLAALVATAAGTAEGRAPLVEMVVAPAPSR